MRPGDRREPIVNDGGGRETFLRTFREICGRMGIEVHAESNGGAVMNPRVVTPNYFMMTQSAQQAVANPMLVDALWADLLQQSKESDLRALFPQGAIDRSFSWGLSFAAMIQDLRNALCRSQSGAGRYACSAGPTGHSVAR